MRDPFTAKDLTLEEKKLRLSGRSHILCDNLHRSIRALNTDDAVKLMGEITGLIAEAMGIERQRDAENGDSNDG
jgi:hypothetical protein